MYAACCYILYTYNIIEQNGLYPYIPDSNFKGEKYIRVIDNVELLKNERRR